ncbi:MAG: hypothetical protein PF569_01605 [Candidatus Woesearchaeota archaeon]|jgi:hypothetical protein|nr:hypothetical protein [Candidatus Woesearchaeota archaeon]
MSEYNGEERTRTNNICKYSFSCIHQDKIELSDFTKMKICRFY